MKSTVTVVSAAHVRAYYHVLAHFDLGADPAGCLNAAWTRAADSLRPPSRMSPARSFGHFHARYRKAGGRAALGLLPIVARDETLCESALKSLIDLEGPPPQITPLARRAIAPLADGAGSKLVELLTSVIATERNTYLDAYFRANPPIGAGMESYLSDRVLKLVTVLFGSAPQQIVVFPAEALSTRSFSVNPTSGTHHIAVSPVLHNAFYQVLFALVQHRTNRIMRHHIPAELKANPASPITRQMRFDAAMTATFHLLLRRRSAEVEPFKVWARDQFRLSARSPDAAIEALHAMVLLPDEAVPDIRTLLGDTIEL